MKLLRAVRRGSVLKRKLEPSRRVRPRVEALEDRIYLSRTTLLASFSPVLLSDILLPEPGSPGWTSPAAATPYQELRQAGGYSPAELSIGTAAFPGSTWSAGMLLDQWEQFPGWEQLPEGRELTSGSQAGSEDRSCSPGTESLPWAGAPGSEDSANHEVWLTDEFFAQAGHWGRVAEGAGGATTVHSAGDADGPPGPASVADRSPVPQGLGSQSVAQAKPVLLAVTAQERHGPAKAGVETAPFAIHRLSPADGAVRVHFDLTTIYSQGELRSRRHAVTLTPQDQSITIPTQWMCNGSGSEIVMLTVHATPAYQARPASVSWFVSGSARLCSDAALLQAYHHGGCQQAFTALVQQHQPQVLRICRQILGNYADAEDVSQNVFLMLATRPPKSDQSLPGWLHTVARNAAISYLRSRTRRAYHEAKAARELATRSTANSEVPVEDLEAALAGLPDPFQTAVRLRYLQNYSQQEAAQLMGCPRGTLAQRAARGIMQLRQMLQQALSSAC